MPTISPGQSWQAAVDANPAGTVFTIAAGTHTNATCVPKAGNEFNGPTVWPPTAVLNGSGTTVYAINGGTSAQPINVRVRYLEVTNYNSPVQQAPVRAGDGGNNNATGWIVDHLYSHHNANLGLRLGHAMQVLGGRYSFNTRLGIGGVGNNIVVGGPDLNPLNRVEIDNNDPTNADTGFESGGTKFVLTNGLQVRNVWTHHNQGNGLWMDICNNNWLVEHVVSEDNLENGLSVEISYAGTFRYNICRRNGFKTPPVTTWPAVAGIGVHHSGGTGIEIYGNRLINNAFGIGLIQQQRGTAFGDPGGEILGPYLTQNVSCHDNVIIMRPTSVGSAWVVQDFASSPDIFTRNNHFENNKYFTFATHTSPFAWSGGNRTFAAWQGFGHDDTGSRLEILARYEAGDPTT